MNETNRKVNHFLFHSIRKLNQYLHTYANNECDTHILNIILFTLNLFIFLSPFLNENIETNHVNFSSALNSVIQSIIRSHCVSYEWNAYKHRNFE